jgi:hypothetical protein
MEIRNGAIETLEAVQGGLGLQEFIRRAAVAALKERLVLTFSLARIFAQRPTRGCRLPPETDWKPKKARPAPAPPLSPWDLPLQKVQDDIARLLVCKWEARSCVPYETGRPLTLHVDSTGTRIETVEWTALVATRPSRSAAEIVDRDMTIQVFEYLLVKWQAKPIWLEQELWAARKYRERVTMEIDGVKILIENLQPTESDTYAKIVMTKKDSLDEFMAKWD